jgi:hypothetical protein
MRAKLTIQPELGRTRLWLKLEGGERLLDLGVSNRLPGLEGLEVNGKANLDPEVVQRLLDALADVVEAVAVPVPA